MANSMYIQLVNMHKKVDQTCAISRNRHSYIDKIEWLYNNVTTLIKYLIKDKIKEKNEGGKQYVTAGNDKTRRDYFQRGTSSGGKR